MYGRALVSLPRNERGQRWLIDEADSFMKDNEEMRGILKFRAYQDRRACDPQYRGQWRA